MTPFRWLVVAGCTYELAAIHEKSPLPTISRTLNICSAHKLGRFAAWMWCGAWAYHFLVE